MLMVSQEINAVLKPLRDVSRKSIHASDEKYEQLQCTCIVEWTESRSSLEQG